MMSHQPSAGTLSNFSKWFMKEGERKNRSEIDCKIV